jgi:tetratricopeptide (TPR) repeat protein
MKPYVLLFLVLLVTAGLQAQTLADKVAQASCPCLDSLESYQQMEDSLANCVALGMAEMLTQGSPEDLKILNSVKGITALFEEVKGKLGSYCYNVRRLVIEEKRRMFYKTSSNQSAEEYYEVGNNYLRNKDYERAIKEYEKAIKLDKNFVYAYDNIAISYRRQENFKMAIKYYQKSLAIFPEGDVAILNIAVAYSLLKDYDNALKYYNSLIYLYRDDPEGYFGAGKMLFIKGAFEPALEHVFTAHRIYTETNSEYMEDSKLLIGIMFKSLKEMGNEELFTTIAKKHNISISE